MLQQHHGVCVSASTSRRQAEAIGASAEVVQDEQAKAVLLQDSSLSEKEDTSKIPAKQAISSDGCYISLRGKVYAEVKTAVIGEVQENKRRFTQRPEKASENDKDHLLFTHGPFRNLYNPDTLVKSIGANFFKQKKFVQFLMEAQYENHDS